MERTELLESLLQVSCDAESTKAISNELNSYLDVLAGVVVESVKSLSPTRLASDGMLDLALKCLVNFCADECLCRQLHSISKQQRREALVECLVAVGFLIETNDALKECSISLLVNLTLVDAWTFIFCDAPYRDSVYRKIASKRQPSETELKLILNLTASDKMRVYMCSESECLSSLASLLHEMKSESTRLTIAGIIKNCCFEESCHNATNFDMSYLLVNFCDPKDRIDEEDKNNLGSLLRDAYNTNSAKRETSIAVKNVICEALMQMCSTERGRSHLRGLGAYFVLRELHRFECAQETKISPKGKEHQAEQRRLVFNVEQVVDQLICEEKERLPEHKNLRNVQLDDKAQRQLDEARSDFLKCD